MFRRSIIALLVVGVAAFAITACAAPAAPAPTVSITQPTAAPAQPTAAPAQPTAAPSEPTQAPAMTKLSGTISADGSSTVFPITEGMAEEFGKLHPDVKITVGIKGTGGGFKVFCSENPAEQTVIQDASRAIKPEEAELCKKAGVEFAEFLVGLDGLTVVVNPKNDFAACLTTDELKKIWDTGSTVKNWKEVNDKFPDRPLTLYGPGTDSGTFDFFTEVINGEAKRSRPDYTASEDDNTLVQGVAGDENALGYFGLAYYLENQDKLKALEIDGGKGCVAPSFESVANGSYRPLSRPLYIYVNMKALERPEVYEFVKFYLSNAPEIVAAVDYVPVSGEAYAADLEKLEKMRQ